MLTAVAHVVLPTGMLLPESTVHSEIFGVLAAFVAINTVMYSALAVAKMLPKIYPADWIGGRSRRTQSRSIFTESPADITPTAPADKAMASVDTALAGSVVGWSSSWLY